MKKGRYQAKDISDRAMLAEVYRLAPYVDYESGMGACVYNMTIRLPDGAPAPGILMHIQESLLIIDKNIE